MIRHSFLSHVDHKGRGLGERVRRVAPNHPFKLLGENLAVGFKLNGLCSRWMKSDPHRRVMLDPRFIRVGAGFAHGGRLHRSYALIFGRVR
jgi:uncharacterized protein YkwD